MLWQTGMCSRPASLTYVGWPTAFHSVAQVFGSFALFLTNVFVPCAPPAPARSESAAAKTTSGSARRNSLVMVCGGERAALFSLVVGGDLPVAAGLLGEAELVGDERLHRRDRDPAGLAGGQQQLEVHRRD